MLVNSGQKLVRGQACEEAGWPIFPAHDPLTVDQNRCGSRSVATVRSRVRVDHIRHGGQFPLVIGYDLKMRKLSLRLLGIFLAFHRNHDHARVPFGKVLMASFELTELYHADAS